MKKFLSSFLALGICLSFSVTFHLIWKAKIMNTSMLVTFVGAQDLAYAPTIVCFLTETRLSTPDF